MDSMQTDPIAKILSGNGPHQAPQRAPAPSTNEVQNEYPHITQAD